MTVLGARVMVHVWGVGAEPARAYGVQSREGGPSQQAGIRGGAGVPCAGLTASLLVFPDVGRGLAGHARSRPECWRWVGSRFPPVALPSLFSPGPRVLSAGGQGSAGRLCSCFQSRRVS